MQHHEARGGLESPLWMPVLIALGLQASAQVTHLDGNRSGALQGLGGGTVGAAGPPRIQVHGAPLAGHPFSLAIDRARPHGVGTISWSPRQQSTFLPAFGAWFHPGQPRIVQPFQLDGAGAATDLFAVERVKPSLCGERFVVQAEILDAEAQGAVAFTQGVRGMFGSPTTGPLFPGRVVPVGRDPRQNAVADLDGDGIPDLVVANNRSNDVSVLLGRGDGTFEPFQRLVVGTNPSSLLLGTFDAGPELDLAVLCNARVFTFLGGGDGTFGSRTSIAVQGELTNHIEQGDLDEDGVTDLVVARGVFSGSVRVLDGNGDGTFTSGGTFPVGENPHGLAIADFDEDGHLDVAVGCNFSNDLSLLFGAGDGTFAPAATLEHPSLESPVRVAAADLDGDGHVDLAVANFSYPDLTLLLGNGDGTFAAKTVPHGGEDANGVTIGDVDGDGILDLVASLASDDSVSLLRGLPGGSFEAPRTRFAGGGPGEPSLGDLDGDGLLDLVVSCMVSLGPESGHVVVLLGERGTYLEGLALVDLPDMYPRWLMDDLDRDGDVDVVIVVSDAPGRVSALLNDGKGAFASSGIVAEVGDAPASVVLADVDGDRILDVVTANILSDDVSILRGRGDGTFDPEQRIATGDAPSALTTCDWNGDGTLDLVVPCRHSSDLTVLQGTGGGAFEALAPVPVGGFTDFVAAGDLDGDGHVDLVLSDHFADQVSMLHGDGSGAFAPAGVLATGDEPFQIALVDVDEDGLLDLTVCNSRSGDLSLFFGAPGGSFHAPQTIDPPLDDWVGGVQVADVDRDGWLDLVLGGSQLVTIFAGRGHRAFEAQESFAAGEGIGIADLDGDLMPDLATFTFIPFLQPKLAVQFNRVLR